MNSIINAMLKYDHRQHVLSDWLAELDQCFQLGEVGEDTNKITWCHLLIGATGSGILSSLDEAATWEETKETLLTLLGIGSVRDKAWAALKNLEKGTKDIVELAGEAEKLAKRLHPRDKEAAKRHAVDAFLGALEKTLAAEVQKLGHRTMEDVVAAARCIEKILEEQSDSKVECLISTMQDQIRLLKKDLRVANDQIAAHKANAPTAATQALPAAPARHIYQDYGEEPNFYRPLHLQMDRQRSDRSSQSQCPNRSRSSTACRSRSPHLPGLWRGTQFLPPSPPSDGSSPTKLFSMRRRRALRVQLSCPPSLSMPPPPTSTSQRLRPASRTNSGSADQRGRPAPQL